MASVNGAVAIHRAFSLDRSGAIVRRSPACGVGRGAPIGPAPSRTRLGRPASTSPSTCFQRRICTETGNALLLGDSYRQPQSESRHHRRRPHRGACPITDSYPRPGTPASACSSNTQQGRRGSGPASCDDPVGGCMEPPQHLRGPGGWDARRDRTATKRRAGGREACGGRALPRGAPKL